MIRYKEKTKDCHLIVKVKLPHGQSVSNNDLEFFVRRCLRGFLKPKRVRSNTLEYTGPIAVSLYDRLKRPIMKYDFFFLIEQIVDATQKLQKNALPWNKVVWDLRHAYINETTKEIQLIYLPLEDVSVRVDIIEFIESIIYSASPVDERNCDFVSRFVYFLKSMPYYDPERIEAYIAREDWSIVNTIKKHTTGGSGFMTDKRKDYYDHYGHEASYIDATDLLSVSDEMTGLLHEDEEATGLLMSNDEEATGLLVEESARYPTLYRVLTEERISISKPVFRLGKERSYVDYFVTNNNAVSRGHADIITRGNRYFVRDLNSKNKTFINGQAIPAQYECEIFDGTRLTLGNEEFIFNT